MFGRRKNPDPANPRVAGTVAAAQADPPASSGFADTELAPPATNDLMAWLEGLPVPALIADNRTRVRWANGAARSWWPAAQTLPQPLATMLEMEPEEVDAALWEAGAALRDWPMRPAGGMAVTCRVAISPLPDARRLLLFTPVDDLHQSVQRARALARRLDVAQDFGALGTWERNLRTMDGRWDRQVWRLWGLEPRESPPPFEQMLQHVLEEDRDALRNTMEASRRQVGSYEQRFRIRRPDGQIARLHVRWISEPGPDGLPLQAVGVMLDDTSALNSGLSEQASQRQLASVVELAGIGICTWDLREGSAYLNRPAWEMLGMEPRPGGISFEEGRCLVHPEDLPASLERFSRTAQGGITERFEERVRRSDGAWRSLVARQSAVTDAEGRVTAVIQVGLDVTDLRAAAVAKAQADAAQHELQAKSKFLSRMSHELRTPLNAMLGFTRLIMADTDGSQRDQQPERLHHIETAGRHLLALIDDILDLSMVEGGEMRMNLKALPLHEQAAQSLALVELLAQRHEVRLAKGSLEPAFAQADTTRLRQVLLNLLSNAVKYNRPGGQVSVSTWGEGEWGVLQVADTGRGMSAEQLQHLFEPFNRLGAENTATEGRGIGMTITKGLVERMGGRLQAQSVLGEGTQFQVWLPRAKPPESTHEPDAARAADEPHASALGASAPPSAAARTAGRVLYIEDNPVNVMIVEQLLQQRPQIAFACAETGAQGLAHAGVEAMRPDLILLDMQLPDMDGLQVFAKLQAQPATAGIPCIALSGNADPSDVEAALQAGFSGYLTKPVDFEAFEATLSRWFGPRG